MAELALRLAFFVVGASFVVQKLGDAFDQNVSMIVAKVLCVPAVILGTASWWRTRSFARSWPVVLCTGIIWIGLFYAVETKHHKGLVFATYVTAALPIAALIVERRCWWLCARYFVYGSSLALGLAIWFEYHSHGSSLLSSLYRFGFLWNERRTVKLSNPNMIGGQLALAALLAFALFLRGGRGGNAALRAAGGPRPFSLSWTVALSMGCLFTASRGAFVTWFCGMGVMFYWGTRVDRLDRLKNLIAVSCVLLAAAIFIAASSGFSPWQTLQSRLQAGDKVFSVSGRLVFWKGAVEAWCSNPRYFFVGTGTGAAPDVLARSCGVTGADGVTFVPTAAHNAFIEWGLSFGLVGIVAGICLMVAFYRRAQLLDRRDGNVTRRAILLCFILCSMTYVTIYRFIVVAAGALILAMLSDPPPVARKSRAADSQSGRAAIPATPSMGSKHAGVPVPAGRIAGTDRRPRTRRVSIGS